MSLIDGGGERDLPTTQGETANGAGLGGKIQGKYDALTSRIIGVFYDVYNELGYGFVEAVYREAMRVALSEAGMQLGTEVSIPVLFRGRTIGVFRADLIVDGVVLLELKTCEQMIRQHQAQTLNYLKATKIEVALLMNFGPKPHLKRFVLDNDKKRQRTQSVGSVRLGVAPLSEGESAVAGAR